MQNTRKKRCARRLDNSKKFIPETGITTEIVALDLDEFEAIRLCDYENLSQIDASKSMGVSRATIQRLLLSGRKKIVDAFLHNKIISINNKTENIILKGENNMTRDNSKPYIIAFPTSDKITVDEHFGHTKLFALYTVLNNEITEINFVTPPPHEPGVLPRFLAEKNANVIVTGGMGRMAINLFKANDIDVILGASGTLEENIKDFLHGDLESTGSACDHHDGEHHHHH